MWPANYQGKTVHVTAVCCLDLRPLLTYCHSHTAGTDSRMDQAKTFLQGVLLKEFDWFDRARWDLVPQGDCCGSEGLTDEESMAIKEIFYTASYLMTRLQDIQVLKVPTPELREMPVISGYTCRRSLLRFTGRVIEVTKEGVKLFIQNYTTEGPEAYICFKEIAMRCLTLMGRIRSFVTVVNPGLFHLLSSRNKN